MNQMNDKSNSSVMDAVVLAAMDDEDDAPLTDNQNGLEIEDQEAMIC